MADGKGWLFVPSGLKDGPLPTHYEPEEGAGAQRALRPADQPDRQESGSGATTA